MRTVELFSGCGGMSKGFQNAGFDIVSAYEFWDAAIDCYKENFNHPVKKVDLSDTDAAIKIIRLDSPDLIIGGPPCQDFSSAGRRVESEKAGLTKSYANVIDAIRPRYFIMENVDRASKSHSYAEAREVFKKAGYGLTERVLNASMCGAPQNRKRFICMGALGENDDFAAEYLDSRLSKKPMTLRDYFGNSLDIEYYYRHPRNYSRRGIFSIDEPAPTMRGVNRPVPKGYTGNQNDACPINEDIRSLTTLERSLIQTFPSEFKWVGTKTDVEQMIGNAVPVKLAEYVANALLLYLNNKKAKIKISDEDMFLSWLTTQKKYSQRSAGDVVSRLRRADSLSPVCDPYDEFVFKLEHINEFNEFTPSVKSHVKKSVQLYNEYRGIAPP